MNNKRRAFVAEYLKDFNATQAAIRAGYSEKTAYSSGPRLLENVEISVAIKKALDEKQMSAEEALVLQADIARGDMADFMDSSTLMLDIRKAKEAGKTKLIKKIKQRTVTKLGKNESDEDVEIHDIEIELYSADAAQDRILRHHGQYNDKLNLNVNGEIVLKRVGVDTDEL
jgi:phage terminase small subunit